MRTLITILIITLISCTTSQYRPEYSDSYYPPSAQYDTTVERVHYQYDTYRSVKHGIPLDLARTIRIKAAAEGIPIGIAFSLIQIESSFQIHAVSHAGAIGLTQVMPDTGREHCGLSKTRLREPDSNVSCGFSYLSMLYERLGRWDHALASYNVGDARRVRAHLTGEPDGSWYAALVLGGVESS